MKQRLFKNYLIFSWGVLKWIRLLTDLMVQKISAKNIGKYQLRCGLAP